MNTRLINTLILFSFLLFSGAACFGQNGGFSYSPSCDPIPDEMVRFILLKGAFYTSPGKTDSVPIQSFNISKYEERNSQYGAYLSFLLKHHEFLLYQMALPDTLFWQKTELDTSDRNYLVQHYLRDPLFGDYPVLGVSVEQANSYCQWKSDRLAEMILIKEGILEFVENDTSKDYFKVENYYGGSGKTSELFIDSDRRKYGKSSVRMEDGIFPPPFRLPKTQEWDYVIYTNKEEKMTTYKKAVAMKKKKYDPKGHFAYLFPTEKKAMTNDLLIRLRTKGIEPVNYMRNPPPAINWDAEFGEWASYEDTSEALKPETRYKITKHYFSDKESHAAGFRVVMTEYCSAK